MIIEDGINVDQAEAYALEVFQRLADGMVIVPHELSEEGIRAHFREAEIRSEGASVLPYLALQRTEVVSQLHDWGVDDVVLVSTHG